MPTTDRTPPWYGGLGAGPWIILAVASAGWVFDVYEGQLFTIFKTPMLKELTGGTSSIDFHANVGFAAFLLGGAAGGLFFGLLGDHYGRIRIMAATILVYSGFSALTAFVNSLWQVHVLRFLVALGTGGEWAIAAALVAETFPTRSRATASGIFHASSVVGVALASLTGMFFVTPDSWRWGFLLGLAPALLVLWIRISLREPARSSPTNVQTSESAEDPRPDFAGITPRSGGLSELLGPGPWRSRAFLGLGLATVGLGTYWGIFAWGPELAGSVLAEGSTAEARQSASSLAYLLMNFTGGLLGLLSFAPMASWRGRRFAFAVYHVGAAIFAPLTFLGVRSYPQALWLLPVMAFFVLGMHAGYAIYFPELFPTRLRATGSSVCFNLGRVLGAVILIIRGSLGEILGMRWAVVAISSLFWIGLVILIFAPETRGRELPE
ncbi:MAG: MFS transporter [Isosphaeraceae bacterium]